MPIETQRPNHRRGRAKGVGQLGLTLMVAQRNDIEIANAYRDHPGFCTTGGGEGI